MRRKGNKRCSREELDRMRARSALRSCVRRRGGGTANMRWSLADDVGTGRFVRQLEYNKGGKLPRLRNSRSCTLATLVQRTGKGTLEGLQRTMKRDMLNGGYGYDVVPQH